eukprot:6213401-Prymnesium_polylepis.3
MELPSAMIRLLSKALAAPPPSVATEFTMELRASATVALVTNIAPPLSTPPPFASVILSSRSRAPPSTEKMREAPSASSIAPVPSETSCRSIACTTIWKPPRARTLPAGRWSASDASGGVAAITARSAAVVVTTTKPPGTSGGMGGCGGVGGLGGCIMRAPQSAQSEPRVQDVYSVPAPPSSQSPSELLGGTGGTGGAGGLGNGGIPIMRTASISSHPVVAV